jgi:hypothetical protein
LLRVKGYGFRVQGSRVHHGVFAGFPPVGGEGRRVSIITTISSATTSTITISTPISYGVTRTRGHDVDHPIVNEPHFLAQLARMAYHATLLGLGYWLQGIGSIGYEGIGYRV